MHARSTPALFMYTVYTVGHRHWPKGATGHGGDGGHAAARGCRDRECPLQEGRSIFEEAQDASSPLQDLLSPPPLSASSPLQDLLSPLVRCVFVSLRVLSPFSLSLLAQDVVIKFRLPAGATAVHRRLPQPFAAGRSAKVRPSPARPHQRHVRVRSNRHAIDTRGHTRTQ